MLKGRVGHLPDRSANIFDLQAARSYFQSAAKESGLEYLTREHLVFTIHGPSGRYPNDKLILEALAKMWTAAFAGNEHFSLRFVISPEAVGTYFNNAKKYGMTLLGGGIDNGHAEGALRLYFMPNSGLNFANYSNSAVISKYKAGVASVDLIESDTFLTDALRIALNERAIVPLYNQYEVWGARRDICYVPRVDGLTLARDFSDQSCL